MFQMMEFRCNLNTKVRCKVFLAHRPRVWWKKRKKTRELGTAEHSCKQWGVWWVPAEPSWLPRFYELDANRILFLCMASSVSSRLTQNPTWADRHRTNRKRGSAVITAAAARTCVHTHQTIHNHHKSAGGIWAFSHDSTLHDSHGE